MRRLVMLVVALAAVWFFWFRGGSAANAAVEGPLVSNGAGENGEPSAKPALAAQPNQQEKPPVVADKTEPVAGAVPELVAAVEAGNGDALAVGYRKLLDLSGAERTRLARALTAAAGEDPATMIAALGDGNAFLHSEEGRAAAKRVVAAGGGLLAEQGVKVFTALVERAMRGTIEKSHQEAAAMVDEIWQAAQPALNRTVFNPEFVAGARTHEVKPGESLDRISAAFRKSGIKVDSYTLALFNRISDPTKLRQKQLLKVPAQPITTVVEKRSFLMAMYLGDVIFRLYWVGHGKEDRTPETTFKIGLKQERPDWHFDGRVIPYGHPENILGAYFVKFEHASFQGYGAHGTPEPQTIGTMASLGCLRMRDADIKDFFRVVPRESELTVRATKNRGSM